MWCRQNKFLSVLLSVLIVLVGVFLFHTGRVWHYERQLGVMAEKIIDAEWCRTLHGRQPQADVRISVSCSFSHIVFGEKSGRINLIFIPRPHMASQIVSELSYYYEDHGEGWVQTDSFGHGIGLVSDYSNSK